MHPSSCHNAEKNAELPTIYTPTGTTKAGRAINVAKCTINNGNGNLEGGSYVTIHAFLSLVIDRWPRSRRRGGRAHVVTLKRATVRE